MGKKENISSCKTSRKPHFQVSTKYQRWYRIGLIVIIVVIVVKLCYAAIVICYKGPYWWSIVIGALAFIVGTAILAWDDIGKESQSSKWRKWLRSKWLRVIFVPIILAVGGLLTTYGWNKHDNYLRDRSLLTAAAVEWRLNKTYIHVQSQRRDEYLIRGNQFSTPIFVLPTARETRQVLTQATSFRNDRPLIHALTLYAMAVDKLVPLSEHIDYLCSEPNATMEMKKRVVETELGKGRDSTFQYFIRVHEQLGNVLTSNYSWSLDEAEALVAKDLLDAIENTWLNITLDPNEPSGHKNND